MCVYVCVRACVWEGECKCCFFFFFLLLMVCVCAFLNFFPYTLEIDACTHQRVAVLGLCMHAHTHTHTHTYTHTLSLSLTHTHTKKYFSQVLFSQVTSIKNILCIFLLKFYSVTTVSKWTKIKHILYIIQIHLA